jgi:hypothetical protein
VSQKAESEVLALLMLTAFAKKSRQKKVFCLAHLGLENAEAV